MTIEIQYKIPSFGPKRTKELLEWRQKVETKFRFDPSRGVDPADIAALRSKFKLLQKQLEDALQNGYKELQFIQHNISKKRNDLSILMEKVAYDFAKATADASLL